MIELSSDPTATTWSLSPDEALLARVARAVADARMGLPVCVEGQTTEDRLWAMSLEFFGSPQSPALGSSSLGVVVSRRRRAALGLDDLVKNHDAPAYLLRFAAHPPQDVLAALANPAFGKSQQALLRSFLRDVVDVTGGSAAESSIQLAKIARLLPTVLVGSASDAPLFGMPLKGSLTKVCTSDIAGFADLQARSVRIVAEAHVPLADAENTRLIAFRPGDGGLEHLAIVVGEPDPGTSVLCRLHSECLTGDLLGSLRCDCGDQLQGAIRAMAREGSGIVLYLAQEGRGIGLVNKLRAYQLQDQGFDTLDANGQLGFEEDERLYLPAAEMLRRLGFSRVRLLTNNPLKVEALESHGIVVSERVPHAFAPNAHNRAYLETKARRGGHFL